MNRKRDVITLILIALLMGEGIGLAQKSDVIGKTYYLADKGNLLVKLPLSWRDQIRYGNQLTSIWFTEPDTRNFMEVHIKLDSGPEIEDASFLERYLKLLQESMVPALIPHESLRFEDITADSKRGRAYSYTSPQQQRTTAKHITQGVMAVGPFLLVFTIGTEDIKSAFRNAGMEVIRSCTYIPSN